MPPSSQLPARAAGTLPFAGREVARIGFGAMQLPGRGVWGPPADHDRAVAVLRQAVDLGVNHIDTADYYGRSVSNELIREALHPYPEDLVLVSKVGAVRDDDGAWLPAQRPEELRAGVEANLRSLAVDRVDVVNLRLTGPEGGREVPPEEVVDLDSQLAEMVALRDEGKIGGVGVSTVTLEQLRQALPAGVVCVQNPYSLLDRAGEPLLQLCAEHGVAWVPYFPLGSAFPGMPKVTENPTVVEVAGQLGATPAQIGLAWLLAHDEHVLLIPGTSSPDHLLENIGAAQVRLDPATKAALDAVAPPAA